MEKRDLLAQIGDAIAAHDASEDAATPLDPRLERLALGDLSREELASLERDGAADARLRAQIELFRPMTGASRADAALASFLGPPPKRRARPVLRFLAYAAPALAAAAALVLVVRGHAPGDLPAYNARIPSADVRERGAGADPVDAVQSGPDFEMIVSPDRPTRGAVMARAYVGRGGALEAWRGSVEISSDGAVRLRGATAVVFGAEAGDRDVLVAIGDADALPESAAAMQRAAASREPPARFRVVARHVRIPAPMNP
jgi:hypothetical protein